MIEEERTNALLTFSYSLQGLGLGVLLIFPAMLSVDLPGLHFGLSFLPVTAIYYWPARASYSWSLLAIFIYGLFYDMVSAGPLGIWTLSFLILYIVLGGRITVKNSLLYNLIGYAMCVIFVFVLVAMFGRLSTGHWPQLYLLLMNALVAIAVFPVLYWVRSLIVMMRGTPELAGQRE
ncbi:MAG: hypothetical protein JKY25_03270 [Robiginitomaculum sp.]|nr:hypothetical protein [Robiginitomaculum sp.]